MKKTRIEIIDDNLFLIIFFFVLAIVYIMSFYYIQNGENIKDLVIIFLTIIGLDLAFSSISFTYANISQKTEKSQLIEIAKNFLLSSILIIPGVFFLYIFIILSKLNHPAFLGGIVLIPMIIMHLLIMIALFFMSKAFNDIISLLID